MLIGGVSGVFGSSLVRLLILSFGALIVIFWFFIPNVPSRVSNTFSPHGDNDQYDTSNPNKTAAILAEKQATFWNELQYVLAENAPDCPSPVKNGSSGAIGFKVVDPPERTDLIQMPEMDVLKMREAHTAFLNMTKTSGLVPPYVPDTRGLVYTAGGKYLPVFVASLRMLRRTNSTLPAEVFLKDSSEYEESICNDVLPDLNAKCVVLSEVLGRASKDYNGTTIPEVEIEHYQLKVFAMLFSSFEDILWLDADCFPLYDPNELFDSEPYKSTGLVAWPDYWASTVSPQYYLIAQAPVPPMNARASSETGEFMISKKTHALTLLISTYYNYYGPSHYFALLSQGAPGEGDKETFLQAADAAGSKYYTVNEPVGAVGHLDSKGGVAGSAMIQYNPMEDYNISLKYSDEKGVVNMNDIPLPNRPRVYFIHAHFPKFNPATIFENKVTKPTYKPDGSYGRAWIVPNNTLQRLGRDMEKEFWEEIKWMSCTLETKFRSWKGKKGICKQVTEYWETVFVNSKDPVPEFKFRSAMSDL